MHLVALDPDPRADHRPPGTDGRPEAPPGDERPDATTALARAATELAAAGDDRRADAVGDLLVAAAAAGVRTACVAAHPAGPADDAAATAHGLVLAREMLQLRRTLPVPDDVRAGAGTVHTRPFRPGLDDAGWLAVNNRAFAWHPEQAEWTIERLAAKQAEPWFDAGGLLVHHGPDGHLDGFCWTKVHPAVDDEPALGEIFVIAVDPDAHGQGLGRALVLAGLDHLADRGLGTAMLYVEADNAPARRLYDDLGFAVHERHRWWTADLAATGP